MADFARGREADGGLTSSLGFLREVVRARITDEDRHVLPTLRAQAGREAVLREPIRQHLQLRSDIEDLTSAAQDELAIQERARMVRRLLRHLEDHLAGEALLVHTVNVNRQSVAANHRFSPCRGTGGPRRCPALRPGRWSRPEPSDPPCPRWAPGAQGNARSTSAVALAAATRPRWLQLGSDPGRPGRLVRAGHAPNGDMTSPGNPSAHLPLMWRYRPAVTTCWAPGPQGRPPEMHPDGHRPGSTLVADGFPMGVAVRDPA